MSQYRRSSRHCNHIDANGWTVLAETSLNTAVAVDIVIILIISVLNFPLQSSMMPKYLYTSIDYILLLKTSQMYW